jgi:SAM-dependent methyltransferase
MAESKQPPSGVGPDANAVYSLGGSEGERARLQRQADELRPDSAALLDRVDLRPGQSAIDLGCGPRGVLDLLAERVSPDGRVLGVDADPVSVALASEFAAEHGLSAVQVLEGDARHTGLPSGAFDVAHTRTLLVTIPAPAEVVAEMVRLVRPGGRVASMEFDMEFSLCYPPHPAFTRICEIFTVVFSRNGADPYLGRKVPQLFRDAGLTDVEVEARAPLYPQGHSRRTIRLDLVRAMRPRVLEMGLASETELDELDAAARAHIADPRIVVQSGLPFLTWGRKPDGSLPSAGRCHWGRGSGFFFWLTPTSWVSEEPRPPISSAPFDQSCSRTCRLRHRPECPPVGYASDTHRRCRWRR